MNKLTEIAMATSTYVVFGPGVLVVMAVSLLLPHRRSLTRALGEGLDLAAGRP